MLLARIDDQAENDWVADTAATMLGAGQRDCMWLGGNDLAVEGDWRWGDGEAFWSGAADGTPVGGLCTNWRNGDPNNLEGLDNCLCEYTSNNADRVDAYCTHLHQTVCELY